MPDITIYANQMAVVSRKEPSKNWSGLDTLEIRTGNSQSYDDPPDKIAYVSFDTSSIPAGAAVSKFVIRFYAQLTVDTTNDQYIEFEADPLDQAFVQNQITYNTKPEQTKKGSSYGLYQNNIPAGYVWYEVTFDDDRAAGEYLEALQNGYKIQIRLEYGRYTTAVAQIKAPLSQQDPQAVITYSPPTVRVSPGFTDGLYIPKNLEKSISWSIGYDSSTHMFGTPKQVSAEVRCKSGGTTKTIRVDGGATTATIPAGTFTEGTGQIQIAITTTAGGTAVSDWITVNNTDETGTAIAVSPRGVRVDGDTNQVFAWDYDSPTGTPQTKAELQVSYDGGGEWQELVTVQGDARQTTVNAGTLEAGTAAWRVRCFNSDGNPGEYSAAAYIIVAKKPLPPSYVTTNGKPRLSVEWASVNQQGYQVQVMSAGQVLFDSGTIFGLAKQLTLPEFLPDGDFTTQVRIIDKQGLWSNWVSIDGSVQNVPAEPISASTAKKHFGVSVEWTTEGEYQDFYLLRDGIPIGKAGAEASEWTDWTANGQHWYTVRGVKNDGYYTDSDAVVGITSVPYGAICQWGDFAHWVVLKLHEGGPFVHSEKRSAGIEYVQYAGRALPVAYGTGWETVSHTVEYTVRQKAEWDALRTLEGQTVLYKDYRGARVVGTLESVEAEHTKRINFSLTIQETDVQERIAYD